MFECASKRVEVLGQPVEIRALSTAQVLEYRARVSEAGEDKAKQAQCLGWLVSACVYDTEGVRVFDDGVAALAADCTAFDALLTHVMAVNGIGAANPTKARRARK